MRNLIISAHRRNGNLWLPDARTLQARALRQKYGFARETATALAELAFGPGTNGGADV